MPIVPVNSMILPCRIIRWYSPLSYRWGSPEWLEMRQRLGELGGTKG
jgi:hypothetical protein